MHSYVSKRYVEYSDHTHVMIGPARKNGMNNMVKPECNGSYCLFCGPMKCICDGYGNVDKEIKDPNYSPDYVKGLHYSDSIWGPEVDELKREKTELIESVKDLKNMLEFYKEVIFKHAVDGKHLIEPVLTRAEKLIEKNE
jgi:hypothetical protein